MRVVAILAVREERPYIANCLNHLVENGIDFAVVDNGSADGCAELVHDPKFKPHLAGYASVPFTGTFNWQEILEEQERLLQTIDADWHVLLAPDEIMHPYVPGETLAKAITRLDADGHDVINFDEFVFLPIDHDYVSDHSGMQPLRYYYFHEPTRPYQMRAWKKTLPVSNIMHGGHLLAGADIRLAPESFALRHYIFRSQAHAFEKYAKRVFASEELGRGWHFDRAGQAAVHFAFPPAAELHCLAAPDDRDFDRTQPREAHYWERRIA